MKGKGRPLQKILYLSFSFVVIKKKKLTFTDVAGMHVGWTLNKCQIIFQNVHDSPLICINISFY